MIPIYRVKTIQIEVTNACNMQCANCTRFVGHHSKPFFMDLDMVRKAIDSLEGYEGNIGLMGGEPTLHPKFPEICDIFKEMIPDKGHRQLWSNGYKWKEYEDKIYDTFCPENIVYNDHSSPAGAHQPLLIAADDIIEDKALMWRLIGSCWIQYRWSASITPKGGFFCEVAAAMDHLFDGPGGYPVEKRWWDKNPEEFVDQVKRHCPMCGAAIPMPRPSSGAASDMVSKSNALRMEKAKAPKYLQGKVNIFDKKITEEDIQKAVKKGWTPWSHRDFKQCTPELCLDENNQLVNINDRKREK
ncbi:MAG: radical SAM protein [Candidatus Omnitrophica bacterium]|nr:radical SAM protein [Candidatus Omnitrophota bacterium]